MKKYIITIITIVLALNINAQCNEPVHSNNPSDNWESCASSINPNSTRGNSHWIQYDLGYIYPITTSHIWNYNVSGQTSKGFKDVVVDYSLDGETWTQLGFYTFTEASGSNVYTGFEGPNFGDINARYILITALNNHGNSCYGIAECKFNIGEDVNIGIQEIKEDNRLSVSPNPAKNIIEISTVNLDVSEIILRNAAGFEIIRYSSDFPKVIDVSYLPSGTYFLIANTKNNEFVLRKFVKINN